MRSKPERRRLRSNANEGPQNLRRGIHLAVMRFTMRFSPLIILLLAITSTLAPAELPYPLPPKAKYTATDADIAKAKADLVANLSPDLNTLSKILTSPLICGPGLWSIVKDSPHFGLPPSIKSTVKVPVAGGKVQELPLATLKLDTEVASFRGALADVLGTQGQLTIREPSELEFKTFWAVIPFDILDGPLLVAEGKDLTIFCMFTRGKVFWIDEVKKMRLSQ
jgi:hypothetical protein